MVTYLSKLYTKTSKADPADEVSINAKLLIRSGFIHKEMAGIYSYLPLGKKVLDNIAGIVRDEMNAIGAFEVQMSILQPQDIWEITGRWDDKVVDNWFKTRLSNGNELGLSLTHEEPVVDSLLPYIKSYKDLPAYIYQIQPKFRNELRARSGILRGREFLMKDMYSFSADEEQHQEFYEKVASAYLKIYERLGIGDITYRTFADGGIFSKFSDEFQTISDIGEDTIYVSEEKRIAVNKEVFNPEVLKELGLKESDLVEKRAVEVGNIFPLASKYSDALGLHYQNEHGETKSIIMGCYGIGISRLMGLLAEHFADERGMVWPKAVAPAQVYVAQLSDDKEVVEQAGVLISKLTDLGVEVIYDDRDLRPGEKFADADLFGIPMRIVVSKKTAESGLYEIKARTSKDSSNLSLDKILGTYS